MSIEDDIKQVEDFIKSGKQRLTFNGNTYNLTTARQLLGQLKAQQESVQKTAAVTNREVSAAQKLVDDRTKNVDKLLKLFAGGPVAGVTQEDIQQAQLELRSAQEGLARITGQEIPVGGIRRVGAPATEGQRATAPDVAAEIAGFRAAFPPTLPEPRKVTDITGTVAAAPATVKKADVDAALAASGLPDTPANRKKIREDLKAGKKPQANWETLVAEQAGEYAYLLDPKYEGVPELLRKAVQQGWFKSDEGQKQFLQEFKATGYYRNTSQKQQLFDKKTPADKQVAVQTEIDKIRAEYGEIQLDQTALEEVATAAARNGASAIELGRLVYRAAFKRGAAQPAFGATVAAKTALGGEDADRIRGIYRAYGQKADDQTIARILAGEADPASGIVMTEDMLRNNLRDIAKVSYKPFADLLDRGISVETIFQPYQAIASRVLEKSPDQVSLLDENGVPTQFASALMSKEPMSLTDWMTTLKSDERYGWQFTSEAKQKATSLVMDLEKAFGFRA